MNTGIKIVGLEPTLFFTRTQAGTLQQQAQLTLENGCGPLTAALSITSPWQLPNIVLGQVEVGTTRHLIYLPDLREPAEIACSLMVDGSIRDQHRSAWEPQKHWEVYMVHGSHHDLGYTDLPSNVLREHAGFLDQVLQYCDETDDWPAESRFRYVAEQAWSVLYFLEHRPVESVQKLIQRIREGRVEVNAFFDNVTSELCGHEEQVRLVYPAFRLKHRYGLSIRTAELNDIPGISWGLVSVLAGCGVRWFAPAIQDYFAWGGKVHPYWDEQAVLPRDVPGCFWWEGPDSSQVLYWHGGDKIEGPMLWDLDQSERDLPAYLDEITRRGFPFDLIRIKFIGGRRDNCPPDIRLSQIVRDWNKRWAYPRMIIATNASFFERFERQEGGSLRVLRGDLPNTDYPVGATSHALELSVNRRTHDTLISAEKFSVCAAFARGISAADVQIYPANLLAEAYDCMLLSDGHVGGAAHPIGIAQAAAWSQKNEWTYRAAALAHDILIKSTNQIADYVQLEGAGVHLVVFNPLSFARSEMVRVCAAPAGPASMPMYWRDPPQGNQGPRELIAGTAFGRNLFSLPVDLLLNPFELIDLSTGQRVPFQVTELDDPFAARPAAAHRWALGQVEQQPTIFPFHLRGHLFELVFCAADVPGMGYKAYQLVPVQKQAEMMTDLHIGETCLENQYYRIEIDPQNGSICSLYDKSLQREWIDRDAVHGFNQLVVRSPIDGELAVEPESGAVRVEIGERGPVSASLVLRLKAPGCPQVTSEIRLHAGMKRVDISNRLLKDAKPLLEMYFAFPFQMSAPQFDFEASNAVIVPIRDQLPGTNTDTYTMQHWVRARDPSGAVVLSSLDAPVVEVGGLWPGYVSQAHHGVTPPGYGHEFLRDPAQFLKGHIYSYVMNNNFRTNFDPVQVADVIFQYAITTGMDAAGVTDASRFGWGASTQLETVPIAGPQFGPLPREGCFCKVDQKNVLLLALKAAEDGKGIILRLLELDGLDCLATVWLRNFSAQLVYLTNLVEEDQQALTLQTDSAGGQIIRVPLKGRSLVTLRCVGTWRFPVQDGLTRL